MLKFTHIHFDLMGSVRIFKIRNRRCGIFYSVSKKVAAKYQGHKKILPHIMDNIKNEKLSLNLIKDMHNMKVSWT